MKKVFIVLLIFSCGYVTSGFIQQRALRRININIDEYWIEDKIKNVVEECRIEGGQVIDDFIYSQRIDC